MVSRSGHDFFRGFRALHFVGPCVTVFGSARFDEHHRYYALAREMGGALARMGFTVMTGGGPGVMEAANRGAQEAGGLSVGCNIKLPMEQDPNPYLGRAAHQLNSAQRLTGRVFYSKSFESNTAGLPVLHAENSFNSYNIQGQHTWTISPGLLGSGQFTANQTKITRGPLPVGPGDGIGFADLGVKINRGAPETAGLKLVPLYRGAVNGYWNLAQDNLVTIDRRTYQATYSLSWIRGRHQIKFGGEYRYSFSDRVTGNGIDPQFTFDGRFSNESFADFLLGRPSAMTQGSLRLNRNANHAPSFYFQDDIKLTKNLTLSTGMRWEPYLPFYATNDELTVFRPGQQSKVFPSAPAGLLYVGDPGVQRRRTETDWNNMASRLVLAWRPGGSTKTSVRAGYGVFFDSPRFHMLSHFVNSPPYSFQTTINQPASFSDPYRGITNPFPYTPPSTPEERARYRFSLPVTVPRRRKSRSRSPRRRWNASSSPLWGVAAA